VSTPLFRPISVETMDSIIVPDRAPRVERVPCDKPLHGVVLCTELFLIQTHYANGNGRICPGSAECEWHKTHRLIPYLLCAIYNKEAHRAVWLQLPPNAGKAILFGCRVLQRDLYGTEVVIDRQWKAMNAPVRAIVPPIQSPRLPQLPKPLTPEKAIDKCFFSPKVTGKKRKPEIK